VKYTPRKERPSRRRRRLAHQVVTIADRPGNEPALEAVRADAPDMQSPAWWRKVWS
jgi:hypothetical protein